MFRPATGAHAVYLTRGSAADIWKIDNDLSEDKTPTTGSVVSKMIRISPHDFVGIADEMEPDQPSDSEVTWENFVKIYQAKVTVWCQLNHSNVVRVHSLAQDLNLRVDYYMHGCVRDGKIFVDSSGRAVIGEFGLTALCYRVALWVSSISFAGFSRWMSPELFEVESDSDYIPTLESDVWALGCTLFEIMSERLPYANYTHDILVQSAIIKGEYPGSLIGLGVIYGPEFCQAILDCWLKDPRERPFVQEVLSLRSNTREISELKTEDTSDQQHAPVHTRRLKTEAKWILQPGAYSTWLEELNEWGDRFKAEISWECVATPGESMAWVATPTGKYVVQGIKMADCTGRGVSKDQAKNNAAKLLSDNRKLTR